MVRLLNILVLLAKVPQVLVTGKLILSFFLISEIGEQAAWAKETTSFLPDIRLDSSGFSMEHISVKDQKSIPFCYSFAAAQMIDAYRETFDKSEEKHFPTSPVAAAIWASWDTGLTYHQTLNYGGFLCEAMDSILRYGSCDEGETNEIFHSIQRSKENSKSKSFSSLIVEKKFRELAIRGPATEEESELDINFESDEWDQGNLKMKILKNLVDESCSGANTNLSHLRLQCITKRRKDSDKLEGQSLIKIVQKALNQGNRSQPIGIKFCSNVFDEGPRYIGIQKKEIGKLSWKKNCHIHYSLIIGRRLKKGKMEFLVRDSYGKDCGSSTLHSSWTCERGSIWIGEEALINNLLEINLLSS